MRLNSLALRLFFSATTWTVVILVVTGIVLSSIYRSAVERAFDRRLGVYLRTLVADVAAPEENVDKFPQSIGEPLFDLPLSGWYWQVTRLDAPTPDVRSSRSLWDATLPQLADLSVSWVPGSARLFYRSGAAPIERSRLAERRAMGRGKKALREGLKVTFAAIPAPTGGRGIFGIEEEPDATGPPKKGF